MTAESATKAVATVGQSLPWTDLVLDSTEKIAAIIPENLLEWRLNDPSGKWHFSLAEIAMHCADSRRMFARQLTGEERQDDYWSGDPGENGIWPFRAYGNKEAILASLKEARAEMRPFFERPASDLMMTTEGTRRIFDKALSGMREKGRDTGVMELRGPANLNRIIMALLCHESGHKSTLLTLLRMHGINVPQE
jgi:hypothetical protein